MKLYLKSTLLGFLAWLIPFVMSFPFYSKDGLVIDVFLFKSIMIVIGAVSGAILLVLYFGSIKESFIKEGAIAGLVWFAINILLDIAVLLPMSGMGIGQYFAEIGLRYLVMPAMSISIGVSLARKHS
ncbi:MAG: hypothetical protein JXB03_12805 [Spirochaetales bacterium]|nr:hypothetical protein [Spirochaetales bacterium]